MIVYKATISEMLIPHAPPFSRLPSCRCICSFHRSHTIVVPAACILSTSFMYIALPAALQRHTRSMSGSFDSANFPHIYRPKSVLIHTQLCLPKFCSFLSPYDVQNKLRSFLSSFLLLPIAFSRYPPLFLLLCLQAMAIITASDVHA